MAGTWKDLTDSVNSMASNLTGQVRNIAEVTTAVANGDLSKKITVEVRGEILELKNTINTWSISSARSPRKSRAWRAKSAPKESSAVRPTCRASAARGAISPTRSTTWPPNLTNQVRNIAEVTTAVANGDLSKQITVDARGEILELKETINTMVDQLRSFASEVTRVAREVGTEGKLGGQAEVKGVAGTWKDLTDSVNYMAANLTGQVRNIAEVTTAVANGDLSKKITAEALGEILELKNTINTMVDQLRAFASEVTRVAREVGTEGRLGGQAEVPGVAGTWKDLTDSVNAMAGNLTGAGAQHRRGHHRRRQRRPVEEDHRRRARRDPGAEEHDQHDGRSAQLVRVARSRAWRARSARKGGSAARPRCTGVAGTWKDLTDSVNSMAGNLTGQVRNIAEVTTAVANGDLSKKITVECAGRDPRAEEHDQHDGRSAQLRSPPKSRAWRARSARKGSSAARPRCRAWPARGRT